MAGGEQNDHPEVDGGERTPVNSDDGGDSRSSNSKDSDSERADNELSDSERAERIRERARRRWVREGVASDAEGSATPERIGAVASLLDSDDAEERASAAWTLAELASENPDGSWQLPVESKLAPLLDDEDQWVRRGASWAVAAIADDHPERARAAMSAVTESLADDDPLVRENSVLAVADVAREYPLAAEPALSKLADIVSDGEGLAQQYAADALRRLVTRLDEDGFPQAIEATPEIAEVLSGDAGVVAVNEDPSEGMPIQIQGAGASASEPEERSDDEDEEDTLGPPDQIPSPPELDATKNEFEQLTDLGKDPLTTTVKARAPSSGEGSQHVVVADRTLRADVQVDAGRVERAFRAWADVDDHDHVMPVLARGSTPRPWLATEFADGGTLRTHLGSLSFDRALWYAHCLTTAVCHAHARGVVHGALRPGAVGLSLALGAWPVPKVGDWGFGDLLADVRDLPVPPAYAAPEHVAPQQFGAPGHATDVYQLGAVCYALFAGRSPFVGEKREIVRKVRTEEPAPPGQFSESVPEAVDALLGRALRKQKQARYETAEDFRRELEVVMEEFGSEKL